MQTQTSSGNAQKTAVPEKFVYFFAAGEAEGNAGMKNTLGGKGANLAEMTQLGLPVPARRHPRRADRARLPLRYEPARRV